MSGSNADLGELLALMHGAQRSFRTLRGVVREWSAAPGGESIARVWVEKPSRLREERVAGSCAPEIRVQDGVRAWESDFHGEHVSDAPRALYEEMLEPAPLIPLLDFELLPPPAEHAGRAVLRARATPRPFSDFALERLSLVGEEHVLTVDRERGIILRVESGSNGTEFVEGEFDVELPGSLWTL